jgi:hypothetical protein
MYKVKLTRVASNHARLRTDTVEGECSLLPTVGECFIMTAPGLEFGTRFVNTSPVKEIIKDGSTERFKTENSEYQLELL